MYPHTKFGISTSKNIGDMDRTRKRDRRTDGLTDGQTVRLLYASQSSFGGIKIELQDILLKKPNQTTEYILDMKKVLLIGTSNPTHINIY